MQTRWGQLFMVGLPGPELEETARWLIQDLQVGGIILFQRNILAPAQVAALIQACQAAALAASGYPLWVAVDQEGGPVQRLRRPFPEMPSAHHFGATGEPAVVTAAARQVGAALRALGITMNLAPVLDVPRTAACPLWERSYSSDPEQVAAFGLAAIEGYLAGGVLPVAKHFPGLGATQLDSHLDLPVAAPGDGERQRDLLPFQRALAAGVPGVMVAHVVVPEWDEKPASLSPVAVSQVLRQRLGCSGLVFTDDLEMGAIRKHYTVADAAVLAAAAGHDVLLICEQAQHVAAALAALSQDAALQEVLQRSRNRLLTLKRLFWAGRSAPA
ncbi:MAG: beta-N-acetylhexosaminidase [Desulfobacca sp.]|uniref:beta-N-acetylhexosaminidase n=1 Tax=Desulfobacca sp. TaxID=2067990 RepID=UPI00404A331A